MNELATVPPERSAGEPPEARGVARDGVRLLVAADDAPLRHITFAGLPQQLRRGDLVVFNTSATEPAAIDAHRADGTPTALHVSGPLPPGTGVTPSAHEVVVELRTPGGRRVDDAVAGEALALPRGATAHLLAGHPDRHRVTGSRLWRARIPVAGGLRSYLAAVGRPIRYDYVTGRWPLSAYRTVVARTEDEFGSAEMPSAGRPLTWSVLSGLVAAGVTVTDLVLHTGVSSLEAGETPLPERYRVPQAAADVVAATRAAGGRVVAVGTTTTRALEAAADADGHVRAASGWTDLVLGPDRPTRVVDGLITGWHEPTASHLLLLQAVAGRNMVERAYAAALAEGYHWHEFGDSCLLLPRRAR